MLRLVPLDVSECIASLFKKGKAPTNEWISSFTPADGDTILNTGAQASEEYKRPRNTIALKLCPANTDIVDLDDDNEPERVIHSSKFDDGSVAATVSLGRNNATGIRWTAISRAVCDVSLSTTSSSSGSRRKKEIVDLASLPTGETYYDEKTPPTITNNAVVDLAESPADDVMNDVKKPPPNDCANRDNKRGVAVASLGMRKPAGKHHVYLDGELIDKPLGREIPLQNGSIISLFGPNGMAYQVHIFQSGDDPKAVDAICNSPKRRKTSPPLKKEETPIMEKEVVSKAEEGKCDGDESIGFCSVCLNEPCGLVFIPCGHLTTCRPCGGQIYQTTRKCPMCREEIERINDVFHSGTRKSEAVNTSQGGRGKAK